MNDVLIILSALTFIFYGTLILTTNHMVQEFRRYQLERFRMLTGCLELAGGLGQLAGLYVPYLLSLSSTGLAVLMLLGTVVRIRTRDPWHAIIPALSLMILNAYLVASRFF